ncbi:MAG: GNAT family N-acetyltransferase [Caulobacteraceae bacterium]|nr:GNAT family N-acetyltransferase [Caulobacteraceae bacterium]
MTIPQPAIRRAGPADAEALARIGRETFTETFGHMYPPADLAAFLAEHHSRERAATDLAHPKKAAWIAERDGEVVGYAAVGPSDLPHAEVGPGSGELKRLYVDAGQQGLGTGRRLLETALAWLESAGLGDIWLSVWSENYGAQRLYQRYGFECVDTYLFQVGSVYDKEFMFRRRKVPV